MNTASRQMRRPVSTRKKAALAIAAGLLALLCCEVLVRVRAWMRFGSAQTGAVDELLVRDPALNIVVPRANARRQGNRISLSVNSLGFRGAEFALQKPSSAIRIVCVGASTTFCGEVSGDDKTWPHRLQSLIRDRYSFEVEVINAGIPGASSSTSLVNLTQRCLQLEPDLVIFYEANNEIAQDTQDLALKTGLIESKRRVSPAVTFLSQYSLLFELVYKNLKISSGGNARKLEDIPESLPLSFVANLGKMKDALGERNITFLMSTFLTKYRPDQTIAVQTRNADVAFYYMPWLDIQRLTKAMELYNSAIVRFAEENKIPVVTDVESVPGDDDHFVDCMHFTDTGCEKMARRFFHFLVERQILEQIAEQRKLVRKD